MRNATSWLQHIPKHWEVKRLKDVCEFRNGYTPSKDVSAFWENGTIPWYRMEDIRLSGRILSKAQQYITEEAVKTGGLFEADSFILATTATIGEHARLIADSLANQQFTNLKIRKSLKNNLLVNYFSYFLYVVDDFCKANIHFSTFPAVDMFELVAMPIPIPPIAEQEKIARYLDKKVEQIDDKVTLIEKKIERYQLLKKSIINQIVTCGLNPSAPLKNSQVSWIGQIPEHWEVKRFKDVFPIISTGFTPDSKNGENFDADDKGYTWITIADFHSKYIDNGNLCITKKVVDEYKPIITLKGALMFSFKLSVGKVAFAAKNLYTNEAIMSISPLNKQHLDYFYYILPKVTLENATENIYGAKMLNQKLIANMQFPIPPLSEQQQIASYLDQKCAEIDAVISNCTAQIEKYKTLKRALINEVVTGQRAIE